MFMSEDASATETDGDFEYSMVEIDSVTYAEITGNTINSCSALVIPETLGEYTVVGIGAGAFKDCTHLVSVTVPANIQYIEDNAFYGCTSLFEVVNLSTLTVDKGSESNGYLGYYAMNVFTSESEATVNTDTDFAYGISKDDEDNDVRYLIKYKGSGGAVTIPDTLVAVYLRAFEGCTSVTSVADSNTVKSVGDYAFSGCTYLDSLTFGSAVGSVGAYACSGCSMLGTVTFSSSPAEIGDHAFEGCTVLSTVNLSDKVTKIGEYAFSGCTNLTAVTVPASVVPFGASALSGCTSLTTATLNGAFTTLGNYAFSGCTVLSTVTLPVSVTAIGSYSFQGCVGLESLSLPDYLVDLGSYVFSGCTKLTGMTLPDTVASIGEGAFSGCSSMTSITVGDSNSAFSSEDGVLFNKTQTSILKYPAAKSGTAYEIPESVATVSSEAFPGCTLLTSVTVPASVTYLGSGAFSGCTSLNTIYYNSTNALDISSDIWPAESESANMVFIHANGGTVSGSALGTGSVSLSGISYTVPADCKFLGYNTAADGTGTVYPASGTYPNSGHTVLYLYYATKLGTWTSGDCTVVLYSDGDMSVTGSGDMKDCSSFASIGWYMYRETVVNVTVSSGVTSIGGYAFYGCSNLDSITVPDTVDYFGAHAFDGCSSVSSIDIPDGTTEIGSYAFRNCSSLTSVTIPDSVSSLGTYAFYGCSGMTLTLAGTFTKIGAYTFYGCSSIAAVAIPSTVTSISETAFQGCTSVGAYTVSGTGSVFEAVDGVLFNTSGSALMLYPAGSSATSYSVPSGTLSVYRYAFAGASALKDVVLPSGLKTVHNYAFADCPSLATVTFPAIGLTSIGGYAFSGCTSLASVSIPDTVTSVGIYAFSGCTSLASVTLSSGISTVPQGMFGGCTSLKTITLPASVTTIGSNVFLGCTELERIDIKCQSFNSIASSSFSIGVSESAVYDVHVNCAVEGFDPTEHSDSYTTFVPNGDEFLITLYNNGEFFRQYSYVPLAAVSVETPEVPEGSVFLKWDVTIPEKMTVGDITANAVWGNDTYTITFKNTDGASYTQSVEYSEPTALHPVQFVSYTKVFLYWTDASDNHFDDRAAVDDSLMYNGGEGTVLTAVWGDPAFIVRFLANGGTGTMNDQPVAEGVSTPLRANEYARTGYGFGGWLWNGMVISDGQHVEDLATDGSVLEFTAIWNPITYTVTFELEGGSGSVDDVVAKYDESFILPGSNVTRSGYTMAGWTAEEGSSVPEYAPSASVSNLTTVNGGTVTLYAVWGDICLTIHFDANGGTGEMADQVIVRGQSAKLQSCTFEKEGSEFLGWATSEDGEVIYTDGQKVTFSGSISDSWTIYAKWSGEGGGGSDQTLALAALGAVVFVILAITVWVVFRR